MNVLLVAPDLNIPNANSEIQEVINNLGARVLLGENATVDALRQEWHAREFDMLWVASHGSRRGIEMHDEFMEIDGLLQILGGTQPDIFLNTCRSIEVAHMLNRVLGVRVVCSIMDIPVLEAYRMGATMSIHLSRGVDLEQAHRNSMGGADHKFVFLNGTVYGNTDQIDDLFLAVADSEQRLNQKLDRLIYSMDNRYQKKLQVAQARAYVAGAFVFLVIVFLGYVDVRVKYGISWPISLLVSTLLFMLSIGLLGWGIGLPLDEVFHPLVGYKKGLDEDEHAEI